MSDLVIVTGGSRGIGRAVLVAAPEGSRVVDVSRSGAEGVASHLAADLSDPGVWGRVADDVARLVAREAPGRATLVHAAGTLEPIGFAGEVESGDYARAVLVNSAAGQVLGHAFLRATAGVDRREIVMISSGAASTAYEGWSAYNAGKAALDHWVRTVGAEQQRRGGATVLGVAPGVVATAMQAQIRATPERDFPHVERFVELHDQGRLADPAGVARRLWRLLETRPASGRVLDLRDLA